MVNEWYNIKKNGGRKNGRKCNKAGASCGIASFSDGGDHIRRDFDLFGGTRQHDADRGAFLHGAFESLRAYRADGCKGRRREEVSSCYREIFSQKIH